MSTHHKPGSVPKYGAEPGSLQELVAIIDHKKPEFIKLATEYGEPDPAKHDLETLTALAMKLAQNHADFQQRFTKEVEGVAGFDEKGFDFMAIFKKIGQVFKTVFTAIKTAVDKHKAAKAAAAKADAAKKEPPKPVAKKGHGPVIVVVIFVAVIIGGLWYWASNEKKA